MATTLSPSNLDKPSTGDFGSSFFVDLEALFDRVNSHTHSGTGDTTKLPSSSVEASVDATSITALNWAGAAPNLTNTVTVPAAFVSGKYVVHFYDNTTKEQYFFKYTISGATMTVHSNTAVAATVIYVS